MAKEETGSVVPEEKIYRVQNAEGISCTSQAPYLGYGMSTLKSLASAGYKLYVNGKAVKFPTEAELKAAQGEEKGKRNGRKKE